MNLIKLLSSKQLQRQPLYGILSPSDISIRLPDNFPIELRNKIVNLIKYQIGILYEGGWDNYNDRQKALNHELYIFPKGKLGSYSERIKNKFEDIYFII